MAVVAFTTAPHALVRAINAELEHKSLDGWVRDRDGDFTRPDSPPEYRAWFRPKIAEDRVRFLVLAPNDRRMSVRSYARAHASFIEFLLSHFDSKFTAASATALPITGDSVGG